MPQRMLLPRRLLLRCAMMLMMPMLLLQLLCLLLLLELPPRTRYGRGGMTPRRRAQMPGVDGCRAGGRLIFQHVLVGSNMLPADAAAR